MQDGNPAEGLRKLVSATSFRLKGTGWYETDFKNKSANKKENKGKSTTTGNSTAKESSTKTTSKAAGSSE